MSNARRKQNSDISRIVGILFLEAIAAILLLNLAGYARQQRSELTPDIPPGGHASTLVQNMVRPRYPYPHAVEFGESFDFDPGKSLPKLAARRYNARW